MLQVYFLDFVYNELCLKFTELETLEGSSEIQTLYLLYFIFLLFTSKNVPYSISISIVHIYFLNCH
jgi:hypothetical protein